MQNQGLLLCLYVISTRKIIQLVFKCGFWKQRRKIIRIMLKRVSLAAAAVVSKTLALHFEKSSSVHQHETGTFLCHI
jgi:hypothetical protein